MFSELPSGLQDLIIFNHRYYSAAFFLILAMIIAVFYVFYYKKNLEKPTTSVGIGILRFGITILSYVLLFMCPYAIYILNPENANNTMITTLQSIYNIFIGITVFLFIFDALRYLPNVIMRMMGFNLDDPEGKKVYSSLKSELSKLPFMRGLNGR